MRVITARKSVMVRQLVRKAQPTLTSVHVNTPLTNIAVAYILNSDLYIASRVFPIVPVKKQSDLYWKFDKSDFLRDEAKPRAPGTESAGGGWNQTTDSYSCQVIAYHKDLDDQTRENYDTIIGYDTVGTEFVTQKMLIRREKQWVASYFVTGVWANESTPGTLWDNAAAKPKVDVTLAKNTVLVSTGFEPRTLVLGNYVYTALQNCPAIMDQFKYTSPESITTEILARYFDVDEVLVAKAVEATNKEGAATTTAFIAGKHALLVYKEKSPALMKPSGGYIMSWNNYAGSAQGASISKFRMNPLRSDRVEGEFAYDMKLVSSDCGYLFLNAVA
jgi:hypothetical protein